jgi:perosamine synthetase
VRIPIATPDIGQEEIRAVVETMKSGWVTQGRKVEDFEKSFAQYCGVKHGVAVNSGTAALHIALASIGLKDGDEVITTPLSCVGSTNPILYLNAKPVFVDVDPVTLNIDPALIEMKITPRTKAILPVHLFGHPVDLDPLMEVAEKHELPIIEDAAEAHGAKYKGKRVGAFGCIACFSFYADKAITTVEGGMALTNDLEMAEKMRELRSFGSCAQEKFYHPVLGYNYKMSDIHAAIGLVQLQKLDKYIQLRRNNIEYLKKHVDNPIMRLPVEQKYAFSVYYVCHVLAKREKSKIVGYLEKSGIETRPLLSFIPEQPPYRKYGYNPDECKIARDSHDKGFYLSNSPSVSKKDLDYLATTLNSACREISK